MSRIHCCCGFGIQSPTDYWFVRNVVNERWPYYAYSALNDDDWLRRRLERLYFRLANWRQPRVALDLVGASDSLLLGCRSVSLCGVDGRFDMAVVPTDGLGLSLLDRCSDDTVMVFQDVYAAPELWQQVVADERVRVSYDLYYCGIALFDRKRTKQHYKINF